MKMKLDLVDIRKYLFMITGKGAYSRLKFESGVHRVQRVRTQKLVVEFIHQLQR